MKFLLFLLILSCAQNPSLKRRPSSEPGKELQKAQNCTAVVNELRSLDSILQDERLKLYKGKFSKQTVQALKDMNIENKDIIDHVVKALAIAQEYDELIKSKIVYYAIAEIVYLNTGSLKEATNLLESLTSTLTYGKTKRAFFDNIRKYLTDFLSSGGNPNAFIGRSISDRAQQVGMNKKEFEIFALFWRDILKEDPDTFQNALLTQMVENDQFFMKEVGEVLKTKKRKLNGTFAKQNSYNVYHVQSGTEPDPVENKIETLQLDSYADFVSAVKKLNETKHDLKGAEFILNSVNNIKEIENQAGVLLHFVTSSVHNSYYWSSDEQVILIDNIRKKCIELGFTYPHVIVIKEAIENISRKAGASRLEIERILQLNWNII